MFLAFAAAILLLFASLSPPVWDKISFLDVQTGAGTNIYGVFGLCLKTASQKVCTARNIGYNLQAAGLDNAK